MWYEVLPVMAIITTAIYIPHIATKGLHTLMFGNPFRRDMTTGFHRNMFARDVRIAGAPWNVLGLDNIPDEPMKEE